MSSWRDCMSSWRDRMSSWRDRMSSWRDRMGSWRDRMSKEEVSFGKSLGAKGGGKATGGRSNNGYFMRR